MGVKPINCIENSTDAAQNCVTPVLASSSIFIYTQPLCAVVPCSASASANFESSFDAAAEGCHASVCGIEYFISLLSNLDLFWTAVLKNIMLDFQN